MIDKSIVLKMMFIDFENLGKLRGQTAQTDPSFRAEIPCPLSTEYIKTPEGRQFVVYDNKSQSSRLIVKDANE